MCHEIGCREPFLSGFALFEDDPFEKDLEHSLRPEDKVRKALFGAASGPTAAEYVFLPNI